METVIFSGSDVDMTCTRLVARILFAMHRQPHEPVLDISLLGIMYLLRSFVIHKHECYAHESCIPLINKVKMSGASDLLRKTIAARNVHTHVHVCRPQHYY